MTSAFAAEVTLKGDSKLTGELVEMNEQGVLTLVTPLATDPLQINSEQISTVDFGLSEADKSSLPDQRIHLVNGDVLPANIEYLSDKTLGIVSPYLGKVEIPRASVDSIQLGIFPQKRVYRFSGDLNGWSGAANSTNIEAKSNGLTFIGQEEISRTLDIPEKFIVRFDLSWTEKPNFQFAFADPLKRRGERSNRYFLQFGSAGLEIKRESDGKTRYTPIAILNRRPEQFAGSKVRVEMRIDREKGIIHLFVDEELQGRYSDPVPNIPDSNGIALRSQVSGETEQNVRNFEILEWDDRGDRHRAESRGDGVEDSMIGRYGERFGGKLISIKDGEGGKVFLFKSDFQEKALQLPEEEVSTVFFKSQNESPVSFNEGGMIIRLQGRGEISADTCTFAADKLTIKHELLGEVDLARSGVTMMERREPSKEKSEK
ncbi:MAG: hypothetical protein AB8D78_11825 [Akkermansiaceae bacterium]